MNRFTYIRPKSLEDTFEYLNPTWGETYILAGGTDLLPLIKADLISPKYVVSLQSIPEMDTITYLPGKGLRIGMQTKLSALVENPIIKEKYSALVQAAASTGTPQLRNMGTIGGNLLHRPKCIYFRGGFDCLLSHNNGNCSAADGQNYQHCIFGDCQCCAVHPSDTAVALQALGASVSIVGRKSQRTVALKDFFTLPQRNRPQENILNADELITEISVPDISAKTKQIFVKVKEHGSWDSALASIAMVIVPDTTMIEYASVVLGGVAPIPWRSESVEFTVIGTDINPIIATKAGDAAIEGAKPLRYNTYKIDLVKNLVTQTLLELAQPTDGKTVIA